MISATSSSSTSTSFRSPAIVRLDLLLREDLDDVDVHLPGDEVAQGVLVAALVHEVAQHDDDALAARLEAEGPQRLRQVARPGRLELVEEVEQPPQAAPAAQRPACDCVSRSLNASITTRSRLTRPMKPSAAATCLA